MTHTTHCLYFSSFYDKYSITFKTLDHSCYQALSTKVINLKVYSLKISFGNITLFQNTGPLPLWGTVHQTYWFKKAYSWIFFPMAISMQGWLFFRRGHLHAKMDFFSPWPSPRMHGFWYSGHAHSSCYLFSFLILTKQNIFKFIQVFSLG